VNRRILLIDADSSFRAALGKQLQSYRFEISPESDVEQALAAGAAAPPALLMVAVDEPDKTGFKIFQRCKKGALAKVPIVLVTSSVAPESFAKHKSLKVHADEYIDKRSVSSDELLGKIDHLVGLGEPAAAAPELASEPDEIPLSSEDMVLEETVGEDEAGDLDLEPTNVPEHRVDSMVDAETDAAFAALLGDDAPLAAPAPAAAEPEPLDEPAALPSPIEPPRARQDDTSVVIAAVPAPIYDPGGRQDSGAFVFDTFSREAMMPPVELIARARTSAATPPARSGGSPRRPAIPRRRRRSRSMSTIWSSSTTTSRWSRRRRPSPRRG